MFLRILLRGTWWPLLSGTYEVLFIIMPCRILMMWLIFRDLNWTSTSLRSYAFYQTLIRFVWESYDFRDWHSWCPYCFSRRIVIDGHLSLQLCDGSSSMEVSSPFSFDSFAFFLKFTVYDFQVISIVFLSAYKSPLHRQLLILIFKPDLVQFLDHFWVLTEVRASQTVLFQEIFFADGWLFAHIFKDVASWEKLVILVLGQAARFPFRYRQLICSF